jgi:adenylate cyclase
MKKRGLSYVTFFLKALIYWVFVYVLYIILRLYGIEQENGLHIIKATYVPLDRMINYAILMGLLIGTSFAIIEFFYDKFISKKNNALVRISL